MRKHRAKERKLLGDPKHNNVLLAKFVNYLMYDGKKSIAYNIVYDALDLVEQKTGEKGIEVFETALNKVMPPVEVKSRRVGGATFQVPTEVRPKRKIGLGIKWVIQFSRKRNERTMHERLANELIAASKGEGASIKKKEDTLRMAEANKAFSHFRF